MWVFSQGCFKFCCVSLKDFYDSIQHTFFKGKILYVGVWSVKMMLIPFINIVYIQIV
jgi:hypothetical protein